MNDKSLDIHLIQNVLDSATKQAPNTVECPEWQASLSTEHHKNLAVPFSRNPFPLMSPVDYSSVDSCPTSHRVNSISNGHATTPKALETRMNNELDCLSTKKKGFALKFY